VLEQRTATETILQKIHNSVSQLQLIKPEVQRKKWTNLSLNYRSSTAEILPNS